MKFSYGKINSKYTTFWAGSVFYPSGTLTELINDDYSSSYAMSQKGDTKADFFSVNILPELTYFISPGFSFYLGLGEVGYSSYNWDSENSNWVISFEPINWRFGVKIKM